jgi:nitrogenase iron protein NifH
MEYAPDCAQAEEYRALADALDANADFSVPTPLSNDELEALLLQYCPPGEGED